MKVLFDQNTPANLRRYLPAHRVVTALQAGWEELENGELLNVAEDAGFEVFVTCDQNLAYRQNLIGRKIAIGELTKANWPKARPYVVEIAAAVDACAPGSYLRVICGT